MDLGREYVDRTNFHVTSPTPPLDIVEVFEWSLGVDGVGGETSLAHSYRSYLPTKIHPPPSPRRISTCHFPRTPLGSRSNLHRVTAFSESITLGLRTAWETKFRMGRIRRRERAVLSVGDFASVGDLWDFPGERVLGSGGGRGRRRCTWRF